ncbi:MAG: hypothetical protein LBI14_05980 [Treponema sp.]|jgi:hypothetical protein|nr:hypothetical protein [Treponema sp.]
MDIENRPMRRIINPKNIYHGVHREHGGIRTEMIFTSSSVKLQAVHRTAALRGYIFLLFLFLPFFFLHAQNSGYYLDMSGERPRFIQRISWIGDEYASRYEVIIEREGEGGYRELLREFTTALFIEVSLASGRYRCHVIPYDFLNQPGEDSWIGFEVLTALSPELDDSLVEFIYSDTDLVYEMKLSGNGLVPGADIYLRGAGAEYIVPFEIRISEDGSEVQLFFNKDQITPGDYELIVRNPGGLEASKGGIAFILLETVPSEALAASDDVSSSEAAVTSEPVTSFGAVEEIVKQKKPKQFDLFLSAGWMPLFPIYYEEDTQFPGRNLSPAGATIRLGMVFPEWYFFNPGLELSVSWCAVNVKTSTAQSFAFGLNLMAQKWFANERMALTFRVGIGYTVLPNWGAIHGNMGISFLWVIAMNLYMETGLNYNHLFTESPFGSGGLRPWVGFGWRF